MVEEFFIAFLDEIISRFCELRNKTKVLDNRIFSPIFKTFEQIDFSLN